MASIQQLATKLVQKKIEVSKKRRSSEKKLKEAITDKRRSSSGLSALQKKLESGRSQLENYVSSLNQLLAQQESIERLKKMAQDRLSREKELKSKYEQELPNADSDYMKQQIVDSIRNAADKITELSSEIKYRNLRAKKLAKLIEGYQKTKSKVSSHIRDQVQTKPVLVNLMKTSIQNSQRYQKQLQARIKQEQGVKKTLAAYNKKLEEQKAKKRKLAAQRAAKKRKLAAIRAAKKRKSSTKKKAKKITKKRTKKQKTSRKSPKTKSKRKAKSRKSKRK